MDRSDTEPTTEHLPLTEARQKLELIHDLFEEQVERTPEAVAAVHQDTSLTYSELNRKANQLARRLRDRGIGPDQLVGICCERSLEMVVGLLGILKAGGAYIPLDPNYPPERLQYMLDDAAPKVLLIQESLKARLPQTKAEISLLSIDFQEAEARTTANLAARDLGLTAESPAYVIYTSGSTGRPKGVEMPHRAVVNLMEWHRSHFCTTGRRVLQFAALSFDVSFQETFSTLCSGGCLVLLDEWIRRDPSALTNFLRGSSIETLFVPPLVLQSVAEHCRVAHIFPEELRDIVTAGEQLRITPEIKTFFEKVGRCKLHNHYGPTETHVVTTLTLAEAPGAWPDLPTIGRPISNTQIHILDNHFQQAPIGVAAEIYIGGLGIARGYLNRPDLTAQRFVADPFSKDPHSRLYKTGDLGRWQADGTIEYLGRNDSQVKIRGFRIELGEIEAQLRQHELVKDVAVLAREDIPGEKRLVAFVVPHDPAEKEAPLGVELLRAYLKPALPDHMVPSLFVVLERLPLTPNGKLDERSLPASEIELDSGEQYEAPQGVVEEPLAKVWQDLLRVNRVGRQDDFFELGGNSLTVMKLIVRIAERFSVQMHAQGVFRNSTLEKLAAYVERLQLESRRSSESSQLELETGVI